MKISWLGWWINHFERLVSSRGAMIVVSEGRHLDIGLWP